MEKFTAGEDLKIGDFVYINENGVVRKTKEKDYKIETKPSLWDVTLSSGCYSDREENHLHFRANDPEEVWHFLCRYIEDIFDVEDSYSSIGGIVDIENREKRYSVKDKNADDIDWDTDYSSDNVQGVTIRHLDVIEFKK